MRRRQRFVGGLIFAALMAGLAGTTHPASQASAVSAEQPANLAAYDDVAAPAPADEGMASLDLLIKDEADPALVAQQIADLGGRVLHRSGSYALVQVPEATVPSLTDRLPVLAFQANTAGVIDPAVPSATTLDGAQAAARLAANLGPMGVSSFREQTGATGSGVRIAIIDSGIDPGHPALQQTDGGRPKVVDWKDFTQEGRVPIAYTVPWEANYVAPNGRLYRLPSQPAASRYARFGLWDESLVVGRIGQDLDRNGSRLDRFGVLLVDATVTGQYDLAYVDTNNNGDFTDEQPLRLFRDAHSVARLGRYREGAAAEEQLSFVMADVDAGGTWVQFGFDALGHGTQVAGVAAAYGEGGFAGVAPGAQLMALKVINSNDQGNWPQIAQAIKYAAEQGAQVINVSLGGLPIASAFDSTASDWLNRVAVDYGVLIILAADNTGPGLSSGATIGDPAEMLSVGAYYSPAMWKRDYGYVVPSEGVWWRSGMGPRSDGSALPNLVAPGGSPTSSPRWLDASGYTTAVGTSIAAPHVSGAAALLHDAGQRNGLSVDRVALKRALELGTRFIPGLEVYEQGKGLVMLAAAYQRLQQLNAIPALKGRTLDGNGGMLARSYRPGSAQFVVTNQTNKLTRVNVFASESWVRSDLRTLTMPPGVSRNLQLQFDPPTIPGVHTAFLELIHQNEVGPSLVIPITYVKPIDLTGPDYLFRTSTMLEVARYRRYFVEVKPGTSALRVAARVQVSGAGETQGTLRTQVFRPDGQMVFASPVIGVKGDGLATLYTTDQPTEGVWEVVVTALPDTDGRILNAGYDLEIQTKPGGTADLPIRYTVGAGSRTEQSLRVTNPQGPFVGKVEVWGLAPKELSQPWRVVHQLRFIDEFTLSSPIGMARFEVADALPESADLDLTLYRLDPVAGWQAYRWSATPGTGREVIEARDLPPGRYQVFVGIDGAAPTGLQYQYRRLMAGEGYHLAVTDESIRRERGQSWEVPLRIYAPSSSGRYLGYAVLTDTEKGQTVAWLPIEVSVGQPALRIEPMVAPLVPGKEGQVVLELRDGSSGRLVDGTVVVNGQRFVSRNGQVAVPVKPMATPLTLQVEANLASYQYYRQEIRLPVANLWLAHPQGVESPGLNDAWRQKVEAVTP